jgi:Zn-dependent protease with chaperone function
MQTFANAVCRSEALPQCRISLVDDSSYARFVWHRREIQIGKVFAARQGELILAVIAHEIGHHMLHERNAAGVGLWRYVAVIYTYLLFLPLMITALMLDSQTMGDLCMGALAVCLLVPSPTMWRKEFRCDAFAARQVGSEMVAAALRHLHPGGWPLVGLIPGSVHPPALLRMRRVRRLDLKPDAHLIAA